MSNPAKVSPRGLPELLGIGLKTAPGLFLGVAASVWGGSWAGRMPWARSIYQVALAWFLLAGMVATRARRGWNLVLFLTFAFVSGGLIDPQSISVLAVALTCLLMIGMLFLGLQLSEISRIGDTMLLLLLGGYFLGWMLFWVLDAPGFMLMGWCVLGTAVFSLLVVLAGNRLKRGGSTPSAIALAGEFYIVSYNLFWLIAMIINPG